MPRRDPKLIAKKLAARAEKLIGELRSGGEPEQATPAPRPRIVAKESGRTITISTPAAKPPTPTESVETDAAPEGEAEEVEATTPDEPAEVEATTAEEEEPAATDDEPAEVAATAEEQSEEPAEAAAATPAGEPTTPDEPAEQVDTPTPTDPGDEDEPALAAAVDAAPTAQATSVEAPAQPAVEPVEDAAPPPPAPAAAAVREFSQQVAESDTDRRRRLALLAFVLLLLASVIAAIVVSATGGNETIEAEAVLDAIEGQAAPGEEVDDVPAPADDAAATESPGEDTTDTNTGAQAQSDNTQADENTTDATTDPPADEDSTNATTDPQADEDSSGTSAQVGEGTTDADTQTGAEPQNDEAAPSADIPESRAIVQDGKIVLEGAVPSQETADAIVALAADILGPDNVVNNYVIDPRAEDPNLGNVRVDDTVLFQPGASVVAPDFEPLLGQALALMTVRPSVTLTIVGHTDSAGDDQANLILSLQRAQAVQRWLIDRGIDADRLTAVGRGETEPIATNDTIEGRQLNRRIQVFIENLLADG